MIKSIGGRWKLLIVRQLMGGPKRFGELGRSVGSVSQKVLTESLRALEEDGYVRRTVYNEIPLRVTYSLTGLGYKLAPILTAFSSVYVSTTENPRPHKSYEKSENFDQKISLARRKIQDAEYLVIGIGSGLSAAYGMDFFDEHLAREWFPSLYAQGLVTIDEMIDVYSAKSDDSGDFWREFIKKITSLPPCEGDRKLFALSEGKKAFVITTNGDKQEEKAGFEKDRIYRPLGDYSLLQCAFPCCDTTYDISEIKGKLVCPICGNLLVPNHYRTRIVSLAGHSGEAFRSFLADTSHHPTVFLEVGCGMRFPTVIRFPFEQSSKSNENATHIRINGAYPMGADICFWEDIPRVLTRITSG